MIGLREIAQLAAGRLGTFDAPCPLCGPFRLSPINRRRPVMRVWQVEIGFATFYCCRCGEKGYARDETAPKPDPINLARVRQELAEREREAIARGLRKAVWLWLQRKPIAGSPVVRYLREARAYGGPLPLTLGFLPARGDHGPAMLAAFGMAEELEPGVIVINDAAIRGVHLTRLRPDGSDRERCYDAKIMIGHSYGWPIVVQPSNDLLGLVITEGIEDALSAHYSTGLGAWAAGCASRLPALADLIPNYVGTITIVVDDDAHGKKYSAELADRADARGFEVRLTSVGGTL
jgi:hypothetical protein